MKNILIVTIIFTLIGITCCKDQLEIVNPNQPTPESAKTEQGIISFAQGALYINGNIPDFFGGVLS
jgi:hypothetical protein